MKKILIVVLALLFAFAFIRIATSVYENTKREDLQSDLENQRITAQDAETLCYTVMGEKDEATGFPFSFGVTGTIEHNGKEYYAIRASWLVNNSHMSYIGDFFVSVDGKEVYTGFAKGENYTFEEKLWTKR